MGFPKGEENGGIGRGKRARRASETNDHLWFMDCWMLFYSDRSVEIVDLRALHYSDVGIPQLW